MKNYIAAFFLLMASSVFSPNPVFASVKNDILLDGNEKEISKKIFLRTLDVIPVGDFVKERKDLVFFRSYIHNFLNGQKLDSARMEAKFQEAKEAITLIRNQSDSEGRTYKVIDAFFNDFSYPTHRTDDLRAEILSLLAKVTLKETNAFYQTGHFSAGKECTQCHFSYSDRHRAKSKTFYTCGLCGVAKSSFKGPKKILVVSSSVVAPIH